ncbi:hypothetical protein PAXINDRAFT_11820 [Paxillus involutus ATCC 200175]|uniref:Uncharacterized protein n=1 Tax=Paxillus involutus ATCC 200175 TaxID=664439 RepID=A0A0C9U881_PAXIN|nr:hypothetical protein PAXINDRAFT_11820 [Paxillus involutus ATCC 200175]
MSQELPLITLELPFEVRTFTFNYEGRRVPTKIILLDPPSHLFASKCICSEILIPPVDSSVTEEQSLVDSPDVMQGAQVPNTEGGSQHAGRVKEKKRKRTRSPSKHSPSMRLKV